MTRRKQLIWVLLTLGLLVGIREYFRRAYHDTTPALPSLEGGDYHHQPMPPEHILNYRLPLYRKWRKPEALPRGPTWVFDLFTPPQITFSGGTLSAELPEYIEDPLAFELDLVSFQKMPFRIQFEGYVLEKTQPKASCKDYILMLNDLRQNRTFRCTTGHAIPSARISVADFRLVRIRSEEGVEVSEPIVTIYDQETEQYVDLGRERKFYDNAYQIVFRSLKSGDSHIFRNIGDSVSVGGATYILAGIDLEEGCVTLRRVQEDGVEMLRSFGVGSGPSVRKKKSSEKAAASAAGPEAENAGEALPAPTR